MEHQDQLNNILTKYKSNQFTLEDAEKLMQIPSDAPVNWDFFFQQIADHRWNALNEKKNIKIFFPGQKFPSISVTGSQCALNCAHCDRKYLHGMIQAPTVNEFNEELEKLVEKKENGALISGGCESDGSVPILKFKDEITAFKEHYGDNYFLNSHVGLISPKDAINVKESGIDMVSFDLILDQPSITEIFHLKRTPRDYINVYEALQKENVKVVPHLLIGAYFGKLSGELDVIRYLLQNQPEKLIFIAMIPPRFKGKIVPPFELLSPQDVARVIFIAHALLPNTKLSLGCMRPKNANKDRMDRWSIFAGASHIVLPSHKTQDLMKELGYETAYFDACCSITESFESILQNKANN
ncbi:MAG: radical SAM protein [Promethearchaeota archaeon]